MILSKKLIVLALVAASLSACSTTEVNCPQSIGPVEQAAVVVPEKGAPPPAPRPAPPPPPRPAPKAPAPAPPKPAPAPPKPNVPKPPPPKPYTPPPIYRPVDRRPGMAYGSPGYNYQTIYVNHQVDHTPLLWMIAANGMMSDHHPQPALECNS